jgi:hypothetical protein
MSDKENLKELVTLILKLLVEKNYNELERRSKGVRLSADDIELIIKEYNCQLIMPPSEAYELMEVVEVKGGKRWFVVMPLWSQEEGRSDLTIELTVMKHGDSFVFEIDNLHVL